MPVAAAQGPALMSTNPSPFGGGGQQPYQFLPESYGARGDGKVITDGVMTSSSANLACTTSTPFASGDVGKSILVSTAGGGAFLPLAATIASFTDSGHVVLSASATSTTGGTPGAVTYYGTDDTAAIKACLAAAVAYAQAHNGYAEVVFGSKIYILAGAATVGGGTLGNAQIPLPVLVGSATAKTTIALRGAVDVTAIPHWLQVSPVINGTVLACTRADGTNDGTFGPASVIGGPFSTYGSGTGNFSNLNIVIDGIQVLVPYNSTFSGFDFWGIAQAGVKNASVFTGSVVPSASAPAPTVSNPNNIINQWTFGLRMPSTGNNDRCDITWFACEGLIWGLIPGEHTTAQSVASLYCVVGIEGSAGTGVTAAHTAHIKNISVEACVQAVGGLTGTAKIDIDVLDVEAILSGGNVIFDPNTHLQGTIGLRGFVSGLGDLSGYTSQNIYSSGTASRAVRVINLENNPGPVTSPQAPPANNATWVNSYYRDAWITLSATTITALKIDAMTQNGLAGSPATYTFFLPSGHSYTPTFTGALTHTVTLV